MIIKVKGIHLYTGLSAEGADSVEALFWMRQNVGRDNFTHLHYGDPEQFADLFAALNTWWPGVIFDKFPFITYDEVDEKYDYTRRYIIGLEDIKNSTLPQLIKL